MLGFPTGTRARVIGSIEERKQTANEETTMRSKDAPWNALPKGWNGAGGLTGSTAGTRKRPRRYVPLPVRACDARAPWGPFGTENLKRRPRTHPPLPEQHSNKKEDCGKEEYGGGIGDCGGTHRRNESAG